MSASIEIYPNKADPTFLEISIRIEEDKRFYSGIGIVAHPLTIFMGQYDEMIYNIGGDNLLNELWKSDEYKRLKYEFEQRLDAEQPEPPRFD